MLFDRIAIVVGLLVVASGMTVNAAEKGPDAVATDQARPSQHDLYQVPDDANVKQLLAFIRNIREFQPQTEREAKLHRVKALATIRVAAERIAEIAKDDDRKLKGFDDAMAVLLLVRANRVRESSPAELQRLVQDIKANLAAGDQVSTFAVSAGTHVASLLEEERPELAADLYRSLSAALSRDKGEPAQQAAAKLAAAARRLTLVGSRLEISGTTTTGQKFDWAKYRGKVVLVDFWATWCGPCMAEMPNVLKNYEQYHDRGFDVVGISLDGDRDELDAFLEGVKLPWVTLHDGEENKNASYYGVLSIPTVILVDRDGRVVSTRARGPELGRQLSALLGGPKKAGKEKDGVAERVKDATTK